MRWLHAIPFVLIALTLSGIIAAATVYYDKKMKKDPEEEEDLRRFMSEW